MAANENLIDPEGARVLRDASQTMVPMAGTIPKPNQAAAAAIGEIGAASMVEETAELVRKLRWGAAPFEGRPDE